MVLSHIQFKESEKVDNSVTKAIDSWNSVLNGLKFEKTNADGDIIITFIKDGKKVAGKTTNSLDNKGFIRKSYIVLSQGAFKHPFSSPQIEQIAKHEIGHVLGLKHANFEGDLMTYRVNLGSGTISSCVIDAVNTANAWKLKEGGLSKHKPTEKFVKC